MPCVDCQKEPRFTTSALCMLRPRARICSRVHSNRLQPRTRDRTQQDTATSAGRPVRRASSAVIVWDRSARGRPPNQRPRPRPNPCPDPRLNLCPHRQRRKPPRSTTTLVPVDEHACTTRLDRSRSEPETGSASAGCLSHACRCGRQGREHRRVNAGAGQRADNAAAAPLSSGRARRHPARACSRGDRQDRAAEDPGAGADPGGGQSARDGLQEHVEGASRFESSACDDAVAIAGCVDVVGCRRGRGSRTWWRYWLKVHGWLSREPQPETTMAVNVPKRETQPAPPSAEPVRPAAPERSAQPAPPNKTRVATKPAATRQSPPAAAKTRVAPAPAPDPIPAARVSLPVVTTTLARSFPISRVAAAAGSAARSVLRTDRRQRGASGRDARRTRCA